VGALPSFAAALLFATSGCNFLFYHPYRGVYALPERPYHAVEIPTEDGLALHGWWLPAQGTPRGTVVQFHGNAGNVTSHFLSLEWVADYGLSLLAFDYRGYGRSPGRPSPEGLDRDARAAIRFAQQLPQGSWEADLVLMGQSLGGAVLLTAYGRLEDRRRVRALVVEGTFHAYSEAAASVLWESKLLLPFTGFAYALVSDDYSPAPYVARVAPTPLLVIHGTRDRVVPPRFGRVVYALASEPKTLWEVPGGAHLRLFTTEARRERLVRHLERL
jgi:fermentation-respiration switch protein FrsA (DUF1100 family)